MSSKCLGNEWWASLAQGLNLSLLHQYSHCLTSSCYWSSQATGGGSRQKERADVTCIGVAGWVKGSQERAPRLPSLASCSGLSALSNSAAPCFLAFKSSLYWQLPDVRSHGFQFSSVITGLCQGNLHLRKNERNRPTGCPRALVEFPLCLLFRFGVTQFSGAIPSREPQPAKNPATPSSTWVQHLPMGPQKEDGMEWNGKPMSNSLRLSNWVKELLTVVHLGSFVCVWVNPMFAPLKLIFPLEATSLLLLQQ